MSNKQARLVAAVADAMNDQGFTQKALATAAGMSAGTLSAALSGRYNLSDVKWQLVCEALALDYDDIVAPPNCRKNWLRKRKTLWSLRWSPLRGCCRQPTRRHTIRQSCVRGTLQRNCGQMSAPAQICRWMICMCC